MNIWDLLGIPPTDDKKAIKRAYAKQVALHHPEEEPDYFRAIHAAYLSALDRCSQSATEQIAPQENSPIFSPPYESVPPTSENAPPNPEQNFPDFKADFEAYTPSTPDVKQTPLQPPPQKEHSTFEEDFKNARPEPPPQEIPFCSSQLGAQFDDILSQHELFNDFSTDFLRDLHALPRVTKNTNKRELSFAKIQWTGFMLSPQFFAYARHHQFSEVATRFFATLHPQNLPIIPLLVRWMYPLLSRYPSDIADKVKSLYGYLRSRTKRKIYPLHGIICLLLLITLFIPSVRDYDLRNLMPFYQPEGSTSEPKNPEGETSSPPLDLDFHALIMDNLTHFYGERYGDIFHFELQETTPYPDYHHIRGELKDGDYPENSPVILGFDIFIPEGVREKDLNFYLFQDEFQRALIEAIAQKHDITGNDGPLFTLNRHPVEKRHEIKPQLLYLTLLPQSHYQFLSQTLQALTKELSSNHFLSMTGEEVYLAINPPPLSSNYPEHYPEPPYLYLLPSESPFSLEELMPYFLTLSELSGQSL